MATISTYKQLLFANHFDVERYAYVLAYIRKENVTRSFFTFQHDSYVNYTKEEDPAVILVGDSIIQTIQCFPIWSEKFVPLKSINLGVCGDRTQNVLWRVQNGLLDYIKPKVNLVVNKYLIFFLVGFYITVDILLSL